MGSSIILCFEIFTTACHLFVLKLELFNAERTEYAFVAYLVYNMWIGIVMTVLHLFVSCSDPGI